MLENTPLAEIIMAVIIAIESVYIAFLKLFKKKR